MERIHCAIPAALHKKIKLHCVNRDESITQFMIRAAKNLLDKETDSAEPFQIEKISMDEQWRYSKSAYLVRTVIPYVGAAEKRTYRMTQDELDDFLEGYNEYGEYLVSIEKVDKESKN